MKVLFVYPRFSRHAEHNPELLTFVPMNEYLGSPSLGIASIAAATPAGWEVEYRDDRLEPADRPTDADIVAMSFFTPAASRALELGDYFKSQGKTVIAGGIFPSMMPDEVQPHVTTVVQHEGEEIWPRLLEDFQKGELKPRYVGVPADLAKAKLPRVDLYFGSERPGFLPDDYPLQLSRGCPMTCVACALPKVMHESIRTYPFEHVLGQLDQLAAAGKRACLTEDTSWFPGSGRTRLGQLFDYLASTGRTMSVSYVGISMPMLVALQPSMLARARKAGVTMFYLVGGFDPITTKAFCKDEPQALAKAELAIKKSLDAGIEPYTSFLIGNDDDDEGTVDRMLEFARRSGIKKAEFAIFTPYPNTPSWHRLLAEGRILTREWSRYNDANVVFQPKHFTPDGLRQAYLRLWREFYADRTDLQGLGTAERTIQF